MKWWKRRPTMVYRVPRCYVRVDDGGEHLDMNAWKTCGRKVSLVFGLWVNHPSGDKGKLWQVLVPLCSAHEEPFRNPQPKPAWHRPWEQIHAGIMLRLWNETLIVRVHPFSWLWWGFYEGNKNVFYLGPIVLQVVER